MLALDAQVVATARTAADVYNDILAGKLRFILDVRNEEDFGRWRIEGRPSLQVVNVPYFDFIEDEELAAARVPAGQEVLVVCAKEGSSQYVAEILQSRGIKAGYLEGGIMAWGGYYDVRDVAETRFGRVVQIARPARGDLSFMVISDGQAAIIDPLRHTEHYLRVAGQAGARISHIFDTHAHADHISGGAALNRETGAPYYLHAYDAIHPLDMLPARLEYQHISDGQQFQVGQFSVKVIWFPGHTLGQVNYLFTGPDGSSYLFSGDGIFLNSFGRPDLGGRGEAWAPILYDSLFHRLPPHLNENTVILPAHFSQLAEDDGQGRFARPYAVVRRENEALRPRSKEEFLDYVLSRLPVFPPEYVQIKRVNIGLVEPDEEEAGELELGKNVCALAEE